ncbi:hypothetical protein K3495_g14815 [Podosphaera aphanis]|nr:hypothetical protein K3495_g14815 [Podosphaera aphanis]
MEILREAESLSGTTPAANLAATDAANNRRNHDNDRERRGRGGHRLRSQGVSLTAEAILVEDVGVEDIQILSRLGTGKHLMIMKIGVLMVMVTVGISVLSVLSQVIGKKIALRSKEQGKDIMSKNQTIAGKIQM